MSASEQVDVFQFMALRSPEKVDAVKSRQQYVRDDLYRPGEHVQAEAFVSDAQEQPAAARAGRTETDLFSADAVSPTGRLVSQQLFASKAKGKTPRSKRTAPQAAPNKKDALIDAMEALLIKGLTYGSGAQAVATRPIIRTLDLQKPMNAERGAGMLLAGTRLSYVKEGVLHILPGELDDLEVPLSPVLSLAALYLPERSRHTAGTADALKAWRAKLLEQAQTRLGLPAGALPLTSLVFAASGRYTPAFAMTKRMLFDVLYGLYILRRRHAINLEPVQLGLTLCHVLEALALGEYFEAAMDAGKAPNGLEPLLNTLTAAYPALGTLEFRGAADRDVLEQLDLLGPQSPADLAMRLQAVPVIHPLIARLDAGFMPFNTLRPIGVGDLKVVKQKFQGYRKAEIAHIETVLDGETKSRVHRSLDKSENTFTSASSTDNESVKDTQSTSRFELKNESEQVIKTDIGLNANASFSYKGNPVVEASVAAGFSFNNSRSTTDKNAQNFVNEVVAKATSRIQSRVSQTRSQTRISEVEETTTHGFTNTSGDGNISGIYRWLDKVYEAQVFNFGKRMMFEFVLPEPAEFYVESRLYAHAATLDVPKYPVADKTTGGTPDTKLPVKTPQEIDEETYRELSRTYNLDAFPYPPVTLSGIPLKTLTGEVIFRKRDPYDTFKQEVTERFSAKLADVPAGYTVSAVRLTGNATFDTQDELPVYQSVQNTLDLMIETTPVFHRTDETMEVWGDINTLGTPKPRIATPELNYLALPSNFLLKPDVSLSITTKNCLAHELSIHLDLTRSASVLADWQEAVFNEISRKTNQGSASSSTQDLESRRIAYRAAIDELKAKSLNDIIQGRSDLWNEMQVRRELKRQCLAIITKEFDGDPADDLLPTMGGVKVRGSDVVFPAFDVTPGSETSDGKVTEAKAAFMDSPDKPLPLFSTPELGPAAERGRFVQFMEQSFEWGQLSYVFYPYFWARMPQWIQLMHREDMADPLFTEFLQAGSARVLLAVKPGFENAVLHFLATREPWSGGPSPVIGDPLYLPLYDEIRNRQDDLAGATPASEPWNFTLPTSLVFLENETPLVMEYPLPPTP